MRACLAKLGLEVSAQATAVPSLSKLHLSSINHTHVGELLYTWESIMDKEDGEELIRAENDVFHVEKTESRWSLSGLKNAIVGDGATSQKESVSESDDSGIVDYNAVVKTVVPHENAWPDSKETPNFNHALYYASLKEYRQIEDDAEDWGDVLMYGDVVTSTNTLLEKYAS